MWHNIVYYILYGIVWYMLSPFQYLHLHIFLAIFLFMFPWAFQPKKIDLPRRSMASCPWVASILKNFYLEVGGLNNLAPNLAVRGLLTVGILGVVGGVFKGRG